MINEHNCTKLKRKWVDYAASLFWNYKAWFFGLGFGKSKFGLGSFEFRETNVKIN